MIIQIELIVFITQILQLVMEWVVSCFFFQVSLFLWVWQNACALEDHWPPVVNELGPSFTLSLHGENCNATKYFYILLLHGVSSCIKLSHYFLNIFSSWCFHLAIFKCYYLHHIMAFFYNIFFASYLWRA